MRRGSGAGLGRHKSRRRPFSGSPYRAALRAPATAGTVYGAAYWRRGSCQPVGRQSLAARPIGRAARHGGRRPAPARAASGRRGMQRSVRLPGRHDPLACRRRIRRRERCRLRPAWCMVPPLGGTVSAWQLPGGRGGSCRRAGVRRAWRRQSAALYSRPIGRLKIGGRSAPPEWCRQTRYRQSPARRLVPPNGAAQNRLAKARLKTGGGPAARRPDRAGGMVPPIGGTVRCRAIARHRVWCRPIGRHGEWCLQLQARYGAG